MPLTKERQERRRKKGVNVPAKKRRPQGYKRPGPFALPGQRYPIGDVAHAGFAITRLYMESVTDADRKKVIAAIKKRYPKNKKLAERIEKLKAKKMGKKKTTKKGNRRKGKPKGARLAYDDTKKRKKRKKKKTAKKKVAKKKVAKKRKRTTKKGDLRKTSRRAYKKTKDIWDTLTEHLAA